MVVKPRDSRFHSRFLVDERFKTKIQFNGREYAAADEMPVRVRVATNASFTRRPCSIRGATGCKTKGDDHRERFAIQSRRGNVGGGSKLVSRSARNGCFSQALRFRSMRRAQPSTESVPIAAVVSVLAAGAVYLWLRAFFG